MGMNGLPLTIGKVFFVDPVNGNDANGYDPDNGGNAQFPLKTLYGAQNFMRAGKNDVAVIVSNGAASGAAILSTANAQTITPSATAGTLTWAKAACHIVGMAPPTRSQPRARISPPSGTYTQATFNSGNFVSVTASGCQFINFEVFCGFSTGGVNQIAWTDSGGRNYYEAVHFNGMNDAASAADTGSRCLKITTGTDNTFVNCTIGGTGVARSVANAALELAGATGRNTFTTCVFPVWANNAGVLTVLGTGAACIADWQKFQFCEFVNMLASAGGTAQTVLMSMTNAAPGGIIIIDNSMVVGATKWGDANALAAQWMVSVSPTAASSGLAVHPT
jgi:predicted GNAT family acetyltransferase